MERKHCQDGKVECGYLIGNMCKANRDHPITITKQIHDALKVVGCQSWSRYLEWTNEKQDTVQELQVERVGTGRDNPTVPGSIERGIPVSMPLLQESDNNTGRDTGRKERIGGNMNPCDICGKQSIVKESDGHFYCEEHHKDWCKCISHARMLLNYKGDK